MRVIDSFNAAFVSDYVDFQQTHRHMLDAERGEVFVCMAVAFDRRTTVALNIKLLLNKNRFIVNPTNINNIILALDLCKSDA